ncbi:ROK family protein [Nonomuraea sediminis]|uniref:ROK family protein n=1 Tax=Nonomuraea sediminis TaxID=2835864 RepID=UPI001BDC3F98|nr:ROK family protein [Nonomuraea sediminis]
MTLTGQDPSLLRRLNAAAVLRALHAADELTLTQLVKITSISRATVEDVIAGLPDLVQEVDMQVGDPRPVGRPAKRYRFRAEAGHVVGVDIGPHKVLAITADLKGRILDRRRTSVTPETGTADRIAATRAVVRRTLRAAGVDGGQVRALGVATTGVVDPADGRILISDRLPGWAGVDLPTELKGLAEGPVLVGNDTNLAALAEHWRGAAVDAGDVLCLLAGRSLAAGLLIGGKVHQGRNGAAGEIGVMRAFGWYTAFDRFLAFGGSDRVFEAVQAGDAEATAIVRAFARDLAKGVGAAVLTMDPELVVLGGGLSGAGELLAAPLREELADLCLFPVRVVTSELGAESAALGAVRLALDHVEHALFGV